MPPSVPLISTWMERHELRSWMEGEMSWRRKEFLKKKKRERERQRSEKERGGKGRERSQWEKETEEGEDPQRPTQTQPMSDPQHFL